MAGPTDLVMSNGVHARIWRIDLSTYEREVERYGGHEGIEWAEALFEADSGPVLRILELLDPEERADTPWRLALRGCHELLLDLGLDLEARTTVLARKALEELLVALAGSDHPLAPAFEGSTTSTRSFWRQRRPGPSA
jgi:thiopeptide-type bacteriocin biosynthesis protein